MRQPPDTNCRHHEKPESQGVSSPPPPRLSGLGVNGRLSRKWKQMAELVHGRRRPQLPHSSGQDLALPPVIPGLLRVVPKAPVMCMGCSTRGRNAPTHPIQIAATMRNQRAKESHRLLRHACLDSESTGDSRESGSRRQSLFMAGGCHNCHTQAGNPI
jgi:hypothetical protein